MYKQKGARELQKYMSVKALFFSSLAIRLLCWALSQILKAF